MPRSLGLRGLCIARHDMSSIISAPAVPLATLDEARAQVRALIGEGPHRRDLLIEHLHQLQDQYKGLYRRHLVALAAEMRLSMAEVYEVATFYHHFDVIEDDQTPAVRTVRVCDGLSCQLGGAAQLLGSLQNDLGLSGVRVIAAPCVGRCEQAPVAVVDQRPVPRATVEQVSALARDAKLVSGVHPASAPGGQFQPATLAQAAVTTERDTELAPAHVDLDSYRAQGGYALLQRVVSGEVSGDAIIETLEHSGLRGLGGAGFPAGRKWRIVREQAAPRLMAVNIDEGEPGTFKDRTYLEATRTVSWKGC